MLCDRVSRFTCLRHFLLYCVVVVSWDIYLFSVDRHSIELCNTVMKIFLSSTWSPNCRRIFLTVNRRIAYFNADKADDKAQKGIRQGRVAWKLFQLQCYVHRLRDAFAELDNYNNLNFACFHSLLWKKLQHFANCQVVRSENLVHDFNIADLRWHRAIASRLNLDSVVSRFITARAMLALQALY